MRFDQQQFKQLKHFLAANERFACGTYRARAKDYPQYLSDYLDGGPPFSGDAAQRIPRFLKKLDVVSKAFAACEKSPDHKAMKLSHCNAIREFPRDLMQLARFFEAYAEKLKKEQTRVPDAIDELTQLGKDLRLFVDGLKTAGGIAIAKATISHA